MDISKLHNPWRDRLRPASFRGNQFFVETDVRASGRRIALHEYPKRNDPYAEDMGRRARRWQIQGYLIGPNYLIDRDILITALERDGPGALILPLPYLGETVQAMAGPYTISTSRERGGFCVAEMEFVEYGRPGFSVPIVNPAAAIGDAARALEQNTVAPPAAPQPETTGT